MTHPEPEVLLRYAEGQDVPAAVVAHLEDCGDCQSQLDELGWFESRLAAATRIDDGERESLRSATEHAMAASTRTVPFRRLVGWAIAAVAACLLATWALWPRCHGLTEFAVKRYAPDQVVRAERMERFALDLQFDAPRWLALWQLEPAASQRLVPHPDPLRRYLGVPMPLAAGAHRVPDNDVLDFEFAAARPPAGLLLVPSPTELSAADLAAIEALITATPRERLLDAVQETWPEARVLEFPAR